MKILIVDENPEMRQMIRRFIHDIADEIEECADGEKILAAFESFRPDWILLDIEMKKLGGFKIAKRIKQLSSGAAIIFLRSFDDADFANHRSGNRSC
jgi:two-component system, OmpR family, response regulator MprA